MVSSADIMNAAGCYFSGYMEYVSEHSKEVLAVLWVTFCMFAAYAYVQLKPSRIPGVPAVADNSILGYTMIFGHKKQHEIMMSNAKKNNGMYQFRLLGHRVVAISDAKLVKRALLDVLGKGFPFHQILFPRELKGQRVLNIFNLDTNEEWQMRRSKFRHPFSLAALKHFDGDIQTLVDKMGGILSAAAAAREAVPIDRLFGQFTMDVICQVGFQYNLGGLDESAAFLDIRTALLDAFENASLPILLPGLRYLRFVRTGAIKTYFDANDKIRAFSIKIWKHLQTLSLTGQLREGSLGYALMQFSELPGIQEDHVYAEIALMFIAGHETTAHSLSWVVYSLCKHPEVQRKAQAAMDAHTGDNVLPDYVEALVKESMRKYPVVQGSMRRVMQPEGYTIGGVHLKQGDWLTMNSFVVHNLASNWGEDVDEFKPERWLAKDLPEADPLASAAIYGGGGDTKDSVKFLPFSHGPRNCLGMNLALIEMRMALGYLLRSFTFDFNDDNMNNEEYALERHITMKPKDDLSVLIQLREIESN